LENFIFNDVHIDIFSYRTNKKLGFLQNYVLEKVCNISYEKKQLFSQVSNYNKFTICTLIIFIVIKLIIITMLIMVTGDNGAKLDEDINVIKYHQ